MANVSHALKKTKMDMARRVKKAKRGRTIARDVGKRFSTKKYGNRLELRKTKASGESDLKTKKNHQRLPEAMVPPGVLEEQFRGMWKPLS